MRILSFTLLLSVSILTSKASIGFDADSSLFPTIEGWEVSNKRSYETDNLYYAINGAAELYLKYHFEVMHKAEYTADSNYISVELYQHATNIDAFGVYSIESPPEADRYFDIGVQGHREADHIYFLAGRYYIKIRALVVTPASKKAILDIAHQLEADLNNGATVPTIYSVFPDENKVVYSEKYVGENILGYQFLKNSYEVDYEVEGRTFKSFVLKAESNKGALQMFTDYMNYLNFPEREVGEELVHIADKYNGDVYLAQYKNHLICTREGATKEESQKIMSAIIENLKQLE